MRISHTFSHFRDGRVTEGDREKRGLVSNSNTLLRGGVGDKRRERKKERKKEREENYEQTVIVAWTQDRS